MNDINMSAMVEEIALIKSAEYEYPNKAEIKQFLKNVAVYSAGAGIGSGAGYVLNRTVIPKIFKGNPRLRKAFLVGGGALTGLLGTAAMTRNLDMLREAREEDARKRNT